MKKSLTIQIDYDQERIPKDLVKLSHEVTRAYRRLQKRRPELPPILTFHQHMHAERWAVTKTKYNK